MKYIFTFSGGSRISRRGGVDSQGSYVSEILYVKTKESGPLGGRAPGTPPRSANDIDLCLQLEIMVMNVSGANAMISLKNIMPPDIGSGQGLEIILRDSTIF